MTKPTSNQTTSDDLTGHPQPPEAEKPTLEAAYAAEDRVTVTFGYGLNDLNSQRFFVGNLQFGKDRICRDVPYAQAQALQKHYGGGVVRIHPRHATEPEIAKACGVRPDAPAKVAAMLLASDLDAIAAQMQPEDLERLANAIRERALTLQRPSA